VIWKRLVVGNLYTFGQTNGARERALGHSGFPARAFFQILFNQREECRHDGVFLLGWRCLFIHNGNEGMTWRNDLGSDFRFLPEFRVQTKQGLIETDSLRLARSGDGSAEGRHRLCIPIRIMIRSQRGCKPGGVGVLACLTRLAGSISMIKSPPRAGLFHPFWWAPRSAAPHSLRRENARLTRLLLELDERDDLSPEEQTIAEMLTVRIEDYEAQHYPLPRVSPNERLAEFFRVPIDLFV